MKRTFKLKMILNNRSKKPFKILKIIKFNYKMIANKLFKVK